MNSDTDKQNHWMEEKQGQKKQIQNQFYYTQEYLLKKNMSKIK